MLYGVKMKKSELRQIIKKELLKEAKIPGYTKDIESHLFKILQYIYDNKGNPEWKNAYKHYSALNNSLLTLSE